jgi:hypothetical protein
LIAVIGFFINFLPKQVLNELPSTGGDIGSHYWPLHTFKNYALPNFQHWAWNPGNLGGEPHMVHYFPFAFFLMAFLSIFIPLGTAFNVGVILPLAVYPLSIYFCLRAMKLKFPIPILAVLTTLPFIYNENFSMWGGNTLSTLAGQFSHVYALNLILVAIGFFFIDLRKKRFPLLSSIFFSLVVTAHAYVFLVVPFVFLACIVIATRSQRLYILKTSVITGVLTMLLCAWYIVPMLDNQKWVTPFSGVWGFAVAAKGVLVDIFFPIFLIFPIFLLVFIFSKKLRKLGRRFRYPALFWIFPIFAYVAMFFIFPKIGLIDIRAVPQIQFFVCILGGILLGFLFKVFLGRIGQWIIILPLCFLSLWWIDGKVNNFPSWSRWNFSGWQTKYLYKDLKNLSNALHGELYHPRVIFEHNQASNRAGTVRVFEMLPYFANRATLESLHLQATILSPMAFYLQGRISRTPSAPFREFRCPPVNQTGILPQLQLMGVSDLIFITRGILKQARETGYYEEKKKYGPWHHFSVIEKPTLVDFPNKLPKFVKHKDWRHLFYDWFHKYTGNERYLLLSNHKEETFRHNIQKAIDTSGQCSAEVTADFFGITLKTNCPNKFHVLKFAYHSSWKADSGAKLFLLSPGFIGLIPGANEVRLTFGQNIFWKISAWLSPIVFILAVIYIIKNKSKKRRENET